MSSDQPKKPLTEADIRSWDLGMFNMPLAPEADHVRSELRTRATSMLNRALAEIAELRDESANALSLMRAKEAEAAAATMRAEKAEAEVEGLRGDVRKAEKAYERVVSREQRGVEVFDGIIADLRQQLECVHNGLSHVTVDAQEQAVNEAKRDAVVEVLGQLLQFLDGQHQAAVEDHNAGKSLESAITAYARCISRANRLIAEAEKPAEPLAEVRVGLEVPDYHGDCDDFVEVPKHREGDEVLRAALKWAEDDPHQDASCRGFQELLRRALGEGGA